MNKVYQNICTILDCQSLPAADTGTSLSAAQMDSLEAALEARNKEIKILTDKVAESEKSLKASNEKVASLTADLAEAKKLPAAGTTNVVDVPANNSGKTPTPLDAYLQAKSSARALFNALP